jgi:hypothetical protein
VSPGDFWMRDGKLTIKIISNSLVLVFQNFERLISSASVSVGLLGDW